MKKSSLWLSAATALVVSVVLAGCGETTYFAGRQLPPSQLTNRVMVAIQNPGSVTRGALEILDGFYDVRFKYNNNTSTFSVSGYSGALPVTIQNMPEEQLGAVYGSGDGSLGLVDYQKETATGNQSGLNGISSSVFITRNKAFVFAANQQATVLTVVDKSSNGTYALSLPGVYRVSVNPGGTVAMAFVQNSNYAYYPIKLNASQTLAYSGGPSTWPKAAVDCEPQNAPGWCLFQAQSPDSVDGTGTAYGKPLVFDRPVKALFSNDGGTAYVLSCGRECGGASAGYTPIPTGAMIFAPNQQSGKLPTTATLKTYSIPGGASNALIDSSTMYVVGQQLQPDGLFAGRLTVVDLTNNTAGSPISISDGAPGALSRMIESDDNTLWIGMINCSNGERFKTGQDYGCLTMFDTASKTVKLIEPFHGDATGIASVTGLHKIYTAEGGQVYIYSTTDGIAKNNQYVTVTGTAYDVAYMDGLSDANNTVY
ncbi:hypothetical protein [Occallatibacter riparius]|uniref:Lipoprotein n=1 Tax=Occallatibacter riparius TaxID=1002689 RepID=A0A9J7BKV6_9BACT|nr:hypothetical protein [Occallatibacter riparius]UWZ83279.1 hypothetical protein MOP44_22250 [Occallatibacter riparius]